MTVRTAQPTRDIEHLTRLLAEHLSKVHLLAPVGDLELIAADVQSLEDKGLTLFPEPQQAGESLALVLERIAARLGPDKVLRPVVTEDHRIEWMCHWQLNVASRCVFSLEELRYQYPDEVVPKCETPSFYLRRITYEGAGRRWPRGMPAKVQDADRARARARAHQGSELRALLPDRR